MGIEKGIDNPVVRPLWRRATGFMGRHAGKITAAMIGLATYGTWHYGSEGTDQRERRTDIADTDRKRAENADMRANQAAAELAKLEALRRQDPAKFAQVERDVRAANPGLDDEQIRGKIREALEKEATNPGGVLATPTPPTDRSLLWRNDVCEANGLGAPPPSSTRFDGLRVDCEGKLAPESGNRTPVVLQTFKRDAAGTIQFENGRPAIASTHRVLAEISANGQAVTIPRDAAYAGADSLIVQLRDPTNPAKTVPSEIRVGQNRPEMQRFNNP